MNALRSCFPDEGTTRCLGWLRHPPREAALIWIHWLPLHNWPHTLTRHNLKSVSFSTLLNCSFFNTIHRSILSNFHRGSLCHSFIFTLLFFRCLLSPHFLSESLRTNRSVLRTEEKNEKNLRHLDDLAHYHHLISDFTSTVSAAKSAIYLSKINSSASNSRKLFSLFSSLLTPPPPPPLSSLTADYFATYFTKKVKNIRPSFTPMPIQKAPLPTLTCDGLTCFSPLSSEDAHTLVTSNPATTCSFEPISSSLLQNISHDVLLFLTTLINSSLTSGLIPSPF